MDRLNEIKGLILAYFKHYNKVPSYDWLCEKTGLNKTKLKKYIDMLEVQGFLKRNYNRLTVSDDKPGEKKEEKFTFTKNWISIVIRYIMLFVGIVASMMSVYYTYIWFLEFLKPFYAFCLSFAMVLFSVFIFETMLLLKKQKVKFYYLLIFPWIIVLIFSMTSTVAGQYNKRMTRVNKQLQQQNINLKNNVEIKNLENQLQIVNKQLKQKTEEREVFINLLKQFDTLEERKKDWKFYWNTYRQLETTNKIIENLNNKFLQLSIDLTKLKKENIVYEKQIKQDFYNWIGKMFKVDSNLFQFWLSVFPALFIDIISPIAFAIFLFLKNENDYK